MFAAASEPVLPAIGVMFIETPQAITETQGGEDIKDPAW